MTHLPVLPVVWPFGAAFLISFIGCRSRLMARHTAVLAGLVQLILVIVVAGAVLAVGPLEYFLGGWAPPVGIAVRVDAMAAVFLVLLGGVSLAVLVFADGGGDDAVAAPTGPWFWVLVMILTGSMSGLVVAGDLFNLFVMVEITSIAAYGITSITHRPRALEASFKYLVLGSMGSGTILLATALVYGITGQLDIPLAGAGMAGALAAHSRAATAALVLYLVGFALKSGLMPFHTWLPDAHAAAPTTSSALLSGLVVKVNAIAFIKIALGVWGTTLLARTPLPLVLTLFSILAMVGGAVLAWGQTDLKRMLAYSTVGHMGYVFAGIAVGSPNALAGSLLHGFNHALLKACLFLAAGLLVHRSGTRSIARLAGIGKAMPLAAGAFAVAALGMIGVPGTNGFVSKYYLALGSLDAGQPLLTLAVLVSSLLNGVFYLPIVINAFLQPGPPRRAGLEAPAGALLPVLVLSLLIIGLGVWPGFPLRSLLSAAQALLNGH